MGSPSAEEILIREAEEADVPLILHFIRCLAEYERLAHAVVATEELLRRHLFGPAPAARVLIAEESGVPSGFALYFLTFSTFLGRPGIYLEDLYVLPEKRGRGIGRALLVRLARVAQAEGYGRVEWSVLNWNEPAIRFYQSLGAAPMDEWTVYRLTGAALRRLGVGPEETF